MQDPNWRTLNTSSLVCGTNAQVNDPCSGERWLISGDLHSVDCSIRSFGDMFDSCLGSMFDLQSTQMSSFLCSNGLEIDPDRGTETSEYWSQTCTHSSLSMADTYFVTGVADSDERFPGSLDCGSVCSDCDRYIRDDGSYSTPSELLRKQVFPYSGYSCSDMQIVMEDSQLRVDCGSLYAQDCVGLRIAALGGSALLVRAENSLPFSEQSPMIIAAEPTAKVTVSDEIGKEYYLITRVSREPSNRPDSAKPTAKPTMAPSNDPTNKPSRDPTVRPTGKPSPNPSQNPSGNPTGNPTRSPTRNPSAKPTPSPSYDPTRHPSGHPSRSPHRTPTDSPSFNPSPNPTRNPHRKPTIAASKRPSGNPSTNPTAKPSIRPSLSPSLTPSKNPSSHPSRSPIRKPTLNPSERPTDHPTRNPSKSPSMNPTNPSPIRTKYPSSEPTLLPSDHPTRHPSGYPSRNPHRTPTDAPSEIYPTHHPQSKPTRNPSSIPTDVPRASPTAGSVYLIPSMQPSMDLTNHPSYDPTNNPSDQEYETPSVEPTFGVHNWNPTSSPAPLLGELEKSNSDSSGISSEGVSMRTVGIAVGCLIGLACAVTAGYTAISGIGSSAAGSSAASMTSSTNSASSGAAQGSSFFCCALWTAAAVSPAADSEQERLKGNTNARNVSAMGDE